MKRAWRIILNAMTVVSLVLCVATVGLWVRSYWAADGLVYTRDLIAKGIESRQGLFILVTYDYTATLRPRQGWIFASSQNIAWLARFNDKKLSVSMYVAAGKWFRRDAQIEWDGKGKAVRASGFQIPYCLPIVLSAVAPAAAGGHGELGAWAFSLAKVATAS